VESPVQDVPADETFDLLRDPYPLFAKKRREAGVFEGSVMDWSKTPKSMMPEHLYAAVSFDAVNRVFRDGKVFNSHIYDSTIGLFIGPTILAMEGKKHWEHRNLVSAAFKSKSLLRWEPEIVRPVVNTLIDEFIDAGEADLVKDFTFEFPTRVISKLLGLPEEDLAWFRKRAVELISYTVRYKRAFEASAQLKDYFLQQIEQRRSKPTDDIIGDLVTAEIDGEKLIDEAIYSFLRLLLPRGTGDHLPVVRKPSLSVAEPPRPVPRGPGGPRAHRARDRGGPAFRDTADHGAAVRDGGHRSGRRGTSGRVGDRRLHRLGQSRRKALGAFRGVRHLPEARATPVLCRRRAHVYGATPGPHGDARRAGMPADPADQFPAHHR
jgi:hypothetical protein